MASHGFTEPREIQRRHHETGPALGQVLVVPFQVPLADFLARDHPSLADEETLTIIKPNIRCGTPFFKFLGGMLKKPEAFELAVLDEAREETGAVANIEQLRQIYSTMLRYHPPHAGEFELRMYLAFGCNFDGVFNPRFGEFGDEGEVVMRVCFGDINRSASWPIPTEPHRHANFFPRYLDMLEDAAGK